MTGAVVIGGHVQGLSIIRSLGKRGIPVQLIDDTHISIARYSKYCQKFSKIRFTEDEEEIIHQLVSVGHKEQFKEQVLFPTNDLYVAAISKYANRLTPYYRVLTPRWEVLQEAYDKRNTYTFAKRHHIPVPETYFVNSESELDEFGQHLNYPILLKPAVMHRFYRIFKRKLFCIPNPEELHKISQKVLKYLPVKEIMLQEIIPGPASHIYSFGSFYKTAEQWVAFTNKHTRQFPTDFGTVATLVECEEQNEVTQLSLQVLKAMGYFGLSEIEYKYDSRDHQYKLLDMNPRSWKQIGLGAMVGLDLPYYSYCDAIGKPIEWAQTTYSESVRWIDSILDVYTSFSEIAKLRLNFADYLKSLQTPRMFAVLSRDDFMPFLMEVLLFPFLWSKR